MRTKETMTDETLINCAKALMATLIFTDMDKDSFITSGECPLGVAADLADDLFEHVVHPDEQHDHSAPDAGDDWGGPEGTKH